MVCCKRYALPAVQFYNKPPKVTVLRLCGLYYPARKPVIIAANVACYSVPCLSILKTAHSVIYCTLLYPYISKGFALVVMV